MEVSGVRRSWETLAICLRKLSSRLRRDAGLPLLVLQQAVDLGQQLLQPVVRTVQPQAGAWNHAGLFQVSGRPAQSAASAVLGIQYRREQDEREDEENQHWRDLLWN